ncbi:oligomeric, coiled-coil, peripheral membrane protein [Pestalotiopsis sp. IQ-011]
MATPRLGRALTTCPNCLGRLPLARPAAAPAPSPLQLGLTLVRHARTLTKAELEDLQGIPVRLLKNINGFGKQNAIIRVKPGRMRNQWHHKGLAEYMTKKRFTELGLTEAAIGVRDRTFGSKLLTEEDVNGPTIAKEPAKSKKKEQIVMTADESRALLQDLLPEVLVFARKPIAASTPEPAPEPVVFRSPALAANAQVSTQATSAAAPSEPETPQQDTKAIFGSVAAGDVVARIREALLIDSNGSRVALETDAVSILGLEAGEDRIKRLGVYEVEIVTGKGLEPVRRTVEVVPETE